MTLDEARKLYDYGRGMQEAHRTFLLDQDQIRAKKGDLDGRALDAFNSLVDPTFFILDALNAFLGGLEDKFGVEVSLRSDERAVWRIRIQLDRAKLGSKVEGKLTVKSMGEYLDSLLKLSKSLRLSDHLFRITGTPEVELTALDKTDLFSALEPLYEMALIKSVSEIKPGIDKDSWWK